MRTSLFIAAALVMGTTAAHAADESISEFQHHAPAGKIEVTPSIGGAWTTISDHNLVAGHESEHVNEFTGQATAEYGVLPQLAIGVGVGYLSGSDREVGGADDGTRTNIDGFQDVQAYARGHINLGMGRLTYGLDSAVSAQSDDVKGNGDVTAATGGFTIQPYVGWEMEAAPGATWGVQAHYMYQGDRTQHDDATNSDTNITGGDLLGMSAFYEWKWKSMLWGGAAIYNHGFSSDAGSNGGAKSDQNNQTDQFALRAYAVVPVCTHVEMIPMGQYAHESFSSNTGPFDHANAWTIQLAARITL